MELKPLPSELSELRNVTISANLVSSFLILQQLTYKRYKTLHYEAFREEWIELYKNTYKIVSKMKSRESSRL